MSYNGFSKRLKKLIDADEYTQKETAEKLEISEHSFTKYLNGRIPNAIILHKLANFYNVSMEWLLVGIEMDNNPDNEFETSKNTIGERLKAARKNKNLTLKEVEIATGISTGNLSELENDKKQPSSPTLILLKKSYDISIDWLLTGEKNYTPSTIRVENDNNFNTIGERIKYLRKIKNLRQQDLANATQISRSNISKIESDTLSPTASSIISLANFFDISTDWLLTGKEKNNISPEIMLKVMNLNENDLVYLDNFLEFLILKNNK